MGWLYRIKQDSRIGAWQRVPGTIKTLEGAKRAVWAKHRSPCQYKTFEITNTDHMTPLAGRQAGRGTKWYSMENDK